VTDEIQNGAPVCPESTPEPAAQPKVTRGGRPHEIDPKTGQPYAMSQKERAAAKRRQKKAREKKREQREEIAAEIAVNDYTDGKVLAKEDALEVLEDRGISPERIDLVYGLATEAARQNELTANEFFFRNGIRKMQESVTAGRPVLLDEITEEDVVGMLDTRSDLYALWDYSCSWRNDADYPERKSFEDYIAFCLRFKDDFFTVNEVLESDFDEESYREWVELMPKLDATKLRRGYTQREMREFLNESAGGPKGCRQRLLVASRASMKSSFVVRWILQQLTILPDLRVTLLSETRPLSKTFLLQLRSFFETRPGRPTRFQQMYPSYCFPTDTEAQTELRSPMAHLNLTQGVLSSSFESSGHAGSRADMLVCDDPLSDKTVGSEEAIAKTISTYDSVRKTLEVNSLGSIVVCTPWAQTDLGATLQKRNEQAESEGDCEFLKYLIDPIFTIKPHATAKAKENLLSLTEDDVILRFKRLDWNHCVREMRSNRENNFSFFKSQNLCSWDQLGEEEFRCTFTEADLKARTRPLAYFEPMAVIDIVLSADLAWSVSKHADLSAIVITKIIKRDNKTIGVVTNCDMGRYKIPELAVRIVEAIHNENPTKIVIEKSGSWQSLADEMKKAAFLRGYMLPAIYWKPTNLGGTSAKTKAMRVKVLESPIADATLWFVQSSWTDAAHVQLVNFDGINMKRLNDFPDALALGWTTFFPGATQGDRTEEMEKAEQLARDAANRKMMYDRIYGSPSINTSKPEEPEPTRGAFGIPRVSAMPGAPAPETFIGGWGAIHRAKQ